MDTDVRDARHSLPRHVRALIVSGGGSRIAYAQGLLQNPTLRKRATQCTVFGGVSAGALFVCALSCCIDDKHATDTLCAHSFTMIPHWGGVNGIFVDACFKQFVFSHAAMCKYIHSVLKTILPNERRWTLKRDITVGLCNLQTSSYKEVHFKKGTHINNTLNDGTTVIDYVVASSAIYGIFQAWTDTHSNVLVDGGYAHNVPLYTLQRATTNSLILSIAPLDFTAILNGNGFWRFIHAANVQFAINLATDLRINHKAPSRTANYSITYNTPHGLLIGPKSNPHTAFTFTYSTSLVNDLRKDGRISALEALNRPLRVSSDVQRSPDTAHRLVACIILFWIILLYAVLA